MSENKEGMTLCGKVNNKDVYEGKNSTSYTLHIAALGMRSLVPVKVSREIYDKTGLGQMFNSAIAYYESKFGVQITVAG